MKELYQTALEIAKSKDVSTKKDSLVLYSISFLPTKENRDKAFAFVHSHADFVTIENTPCGKELENMDLSLLTQEEIFEVWKTASIRMIEQASGNVTAFVDGANERSVFITTELPAILNNPHIKTINKVDKREYLTMISK